jgi:hypothetical protein
MPLEFQDREDAEFANRADTEWNQQITLTIQESASLSSSGSPALTQQHLLSVQPINSLDGLGALLIGGQALLIVDYLKSTISAEQTTVITQSDLIVQESLSLSSSENTISSQQKSLVVQEIKSQSSSGLADLQSLLSFADTDYTTFQDREDTLWASIDKTNSLSIQDSTSLSSSGNTLLDSYLLLSDLTSQINSEGIDWRYLLAGDDEFILTGDGGKIVINQGLTQAHVLTAQGSASSTSIGPTSLTVSIIALVLSGSVSFSTIQGTILAQAHNLTVQGETSLTGSPSVTAVSRHDLVVSGLSSNTSLGQILLNQSQNLIVNEASSVSIADVRAVSASLANTRLSLADGCAFADIVSVTDFLTGHIGELLNVFDNDGNKISGYIKAAGTGETYGPELVNAWTNGNFNTWIPGVGPLITRAAKVGGGGYCAKNTGSLAGKLIKNTNDFTLSVGNLGSFHIALSYYPNGNLIDFDDKATSYRVGRDEVMLGQSNGICIFSNITTDFALTSFSAKQVLTPSVTGVTLVSTPGGSVYNWDIEDSFDYNDTEYLFVIGQMRLTSSQELVIQDAVSVSQAEHLYGWGYASIAIEETASITASESTVLTQQHTISIDSSSSSTAVGISSIEYSQKNLVLSEPRSSSGLTVLDLVRHGSIVLQDAASPSQNEEIELQENVNLAVQNIISASNSEALEFITSYIEVSGAKSYSSTDIIDLTQAHTLALSDMRSANIPENVTVDPSIWGDLNVTFVGTVSGIKFHGHTSEVEFEATHSEVLFKSKRGIYK